MSFSLLGTGNASGASKAGKRKRRKRSRKKKSKSTNNNNGTEKKTAPTPPAAVAATPASAPAPAPSANKLDAIVDVVSKIHKNFTRDKIASVAANLAKTVKNVNAKGVISALQAMSTKAAAKTKAPVARVQGSGILAKLDIAVAHAEGGKVAYETLLEIFRKWVEKNVATIEPFLKSSVLRRLLEFAVSNSSSHKQWNVFMSFLRTLVRVSCATQDKKAAISLTAQIGALLEVVRKSAPDSIGSIVREISLSIVEIYNFNGADVLDLDQQLKLNLIAQAKARKAPAGLKKAFEIRDLQLKCAQLLRKKSERFTGTTVPADDITKGLRTAVNSDINEEESDAIRKQHKNLVETLEKYTKTRDANIRQIEERQQRYRLKLDTLRTERAEHQKAIEELNAKIEAIDKESGSINQALDKTVNSRQAAEQEYESNSAQIKSQNKDSFAKLQKILDAKKVQDCIHALGGSISTILSSISSAQSSEKDGSVSAFFRGSLQYFTSEAVCVSQLTARLKQAREKCASLQTELSDFMGISGMDTMTNKLKTQLEKQTSNIQQDEGVVETLKADSKSIFHSVKALASHATAADKAVLRNMGASLVQLGHEALWGKVESKPAKPVAKQQKAVPAAVPVPAPKAKALPTAAAAATRAKKRPNPVKKKPVASTSGKIKFSWATKKRVAAPVKSFAQIEQEQRQAALKQEETLRTKAQTAAKNQEKKEADAKKAEEAAVLAKAAENLKPEPAPVQENKKDEKEEASADNEDAAVDKGEAAADEAAEADALPKRKRRAKRAPAEAAVDEGAAEAQTSAEVAAGEGAAATVEVAADEGAAATVEVAADEGAAATVEVAADEGAAATIEAAADEGAAEAQTTVEVAADEGAAATVEVAADEGAAATTEAAADEGAAATVEVAADEGAAATTEVAADEGAAATTEVAADEGAAATAEVAADEGAAATTTEVAAHEGAAEAQTSAEVATDEGAAEAQTTSAATWTPYSGDEFSGFVTYSDDSSVGQACPDLSSLKLVPKGHHDEPIEVGKGKPTLLIFFAKYIKYEAFPALKAGEKYCKELGIQTAGILLDNKEKDAARFVEKKVSVPDYPLYHDGGWTVKNSFQALAKGEVMTLPSLFLIGADGTIAWRQALSGNTGAMTFDASQFDYQIRAFVGGKELGAHGSSGRAEDDGEDIGPVEEKTVFECQEVADAIW